MKYTQKTHILLPDFDKDVNDFIYEIMQDTIRKNEISIPGFDWMQLSNFHMKQFPVSFTDSTTYLDYVFLKVKEYILNVFLFEASLRHKSKIIHADIKKRENGEIQEAEDTFQSIRQIIYEYIIKDDKKFDHMKTDLKKRVMVKTDTENFQKMLRKYMCSAKKAELPPYLQAIIKKRDYRELPACTKRLNPYAQFEENCSKKGSAELYWQNFLWTYLLFGDTEELLPQDYAVYIGFISDIFRRKKSIDERCLAYISNYMKDGNQHGNSNTIYKGLCQMYQSHVDEARKCLEGIQKQMEVQGEAYVTNHFLFMGTLKPDFFGSLSGSNIFDYCADKIDFQSLYGCADKDDSQKENSLLKKCKKSESLSYLRMLVLLMKVNINLQELERKDFSLYFDAETRQLENMQPREHYFLAAYIGLKIICEFIDKALTSMGEILNLLLDQFDSFCEACRVEEINSALDALAQLVIRSSEPAAGDAEQLRMPSETYNQKLIACYLLNQSCKGELFTVA